MSNYANWLIDLSAVEVKMIVYGFPVGLLFHVLVWMSDNYPVTLNLINYS